MYLATASTHAYNTRVSITGRASSECLPAVQIKTPEEAERFVRELDAECLPLILDSNGNHVVQRCLQKFAAVHTAKIQALVRQNCLDVARHRHGCCVLQRCMDYAPAETKRRLVLAVAAHGLELSQNAFGNYVVQVRAAPFAGRVPVSDCTSSRSPHLWPQRVPGSGEHRTEHRPEHLTNRAPNGTPAGTPTERNTGRNTYRAQSCRERI